MSWETEHSGSRVWTQSHARRLRLRVQSAAAVCVVVAAAMLGFTMSEAFAATEFGLEGRAAGEFEVPSGLAIRQADGRVYIVDRNNQRVDRFAEGGSFLAAWGWGVADGRTAAAQACTTLCFAGIPGEGDGQFSFPEGLTIDNNLLSSSAGDVYVVDSRNHRVEKFDGEGAFLLTFGRNVKVGGGDVCHAEEACQGGEPGEGEGELEARAGAIALTPSGSVVVGDVNRLEIFSAEGVFEGEISLPGAGTINAVASDASGDLYVIAQELAGVRKFDAKGLELGLPRDGEGAPAAIAVGPSQELYVADSANQVHHVLEYDQEGVELASFNARSGVSGASTGLAVNEHNGDVYVLEGAGVRVVSPPPPGPLVIEGGAAAGEVTPTLAALSGSFNPEGAGVVKWQFEYGTSTAYGASTPVESGAGGEFEDQAVQAGISGLSPATQYHFRLVITNGKGETRFGADAVFTTLPPVALVRTFAADVTSTSARLVADLDPQGVATEYQFDYGLTTAYDEHAPVPEGQIGGGPGAREVSLLVQKLTPGTLYHFRIRAHSTLGEVVGPDETFITQAGAAHGLLDGRDWEMVSPADKRGQSLEGIPNEGGLIQAAADGTALTYFSQSPIESGVEGNRSLTDSQVLATRSVSGWESKDISVRHEKVTPLFPGNYSEYRIFSEDLRAGFIEPEGTTPLSTSATERTPYRREADGSFLPMAFPGNVKPGVKFGGVEAVPDFFVGGVEFVSASKDGTFAALASTQALTKELEDPEELQNVYEWHAGMLRLASIMPSGKAASEEGLNAGLGKGSRSVRGAMSDDGSRIVFTTSGGGNEHLYLRDLILGETVQVDAGEPGAPVPTESRAHFQAASGDGRRVFFTSSDRLTVNATARPSKPDLYMCEATLSSGHLACRIEDLSVTGAPAEAANVQGVVLGLDREGALVYFVADGKLAGGAAAGDCETSTFNVIPEPGVRCNLYVRNVQARTTQLVATLSGRDQNDWAAIAGEDLGGVTARVSGDGRYATFMSQLSLTGFDNRDARSGAPDEEVYLYDHQLGTLTCVSCSRYGTPPTGDFDEGAYPGLLVDRPALWAGSWLAGSIPGWTKIDSPHALYASRVLSDSGRLFFNSATPLVPQDTNGKEDVYEYEPDGVGSCAQPSGCVGLVSSGESGEESAFLDASADGSDAFFITASRLWPSDLDAALDIYDSHACSVASPCLAAPPSGALGCGTGPECRAPGGVSAPESTPASEGASGEGNTRVAASKPIPLSRAQKLARALKACKKVHKGKPRVRCVRRAKKLYGPPLHASHKRRHG